MRAFNRVYDQGRHQIGNYIVSKILCDIAENACDTFNDKVWKQVMYMPWYQVRREIYECTPNPVKKKYETI
jgi:hypothetical protein